jgi:type I restriction enzyme M protein
MCHSCYSHHSTFCCRHCAAWRAIPWRGGGARIRQALIEENLLDGVVGLPAQLFSSTGIPVCMVIFDRAQDTGGARDDADDVFFIDASRDFLAGKKQNALGDTQLDRIIAA